MPKNDCKPLPPLSAEDIASFWNKVEVRGPDECWPWYRPHPKTGYGQFPVKDNGIKRMLRPNRIALFLHTGIDPFPLLACHSCDTRYPRGDISYRRCCNPTHLFPGTSADNSAHMATHERNHSGDEHHFRRHPEWAARGERHGSKQHPEATRRGETCSQSMLTVEDVLEIRRLHQLGVGVRTIARRFKRGRSTITHVVKRDSWTHVP